MRRTARFLVEFVLLGTTEVSAQGVGGYFGQGRSRLSLTAGYASLNDENYAVVGAGAGYYILDGLEAGVDGEAWLGQRPHIYTLSPEVRYTVTQFESIKPYLGGFYK